MKIVVKVKDCGGFKPRDIRNYIGAIVDKEYENTVMWHERQTPELIYPKPFKGGFEIVSSKNNTELINHIAAKIEENKNFYGKKIEKVWLKNEQFNFPVRRLTAYTTRTPIVVASNPVEYGICLACKKTGNEDDLKRYVTHRIKSDVERHIKQWFGVTLTIEGFSLNISNLKQLLLTYKDGIRVPAVTMDFTSNFSLPRFVGYKTGLGWGEIIEKNLFPEVN